MRYKFILTYRQILKLALKCIVQHVTLLKFY